MSIIISSIAAFALLPWLSHSSPELPEYEGVSSATELGHAPQGGSLENKYVYYRSTALWKEWVWGYGIDGGKSLKIRHYDPATKETREFSYSAAFKIADVAAERPRAIRTNSRFVVAGVTDTGAAVIEQWIHKPTKSQVPGTPLVYTMSRSLVYSGTSLGTIDGLQVEPSGKYAVIAHSNPEPHISQISLSAGFTITPLLDANYETLLSNGVITIKRAEHQTEGLLWIVYLSASAFQGSEWAIILRDLNGDDVLDDWMSYTYANMSAEYPSRFSQSPWVNDFKSY